MRRVALVAAAMAAFGCGSSSVSPPVAPVSPGVIPPPIVTVTSSGVDQPVLHVFEGTATVINNDTREHAFFLDPHPGHNPLAADCSMPNIGLMEPGTRREMTGLRPSLCFYHDDLALGDRSLTFSVLVH
jgi:hypothetical protein